MGLTHIGSMSNVRIIISDITVIALARTQLKYGAGLA